MNFRQKIKVAAAEVELGELIEFAIDNGQCGSIEGIRSKLSIKSKIVNNEDLTTEEIVLIKTSALQTLKDAATIAVMEAIAPNDLK